MAPELTLHCPRCDQPIDLGEAEMRARRAGCPSCGTGCDLVRERSIDAGPLRTFDELRLHADPGDRPDGIRVRTTRGITRHVEIANRNPYRPIHLALLGSAATIVIIALLIRLADGRVQYLAFRIAVILVLVLNAVRVYRRRQDEVMIEGGRIRVRRGGIRATTARVPLAQVEDVELAGLEGRRWLEVRLRLPFPRRLDIADGFARTDEDLVWLRDYLRAGIALAREDRGQLASPAERPALAAPKR